ncbi:DUF2946 family protein [Maricaulis sp.]|uniref:DUF2946 family protein n=1 Tax=Maricaulis sp. TaxID=1486257 RepID=UPI001B2BC049|nr:DUF2946 family protein [Maricaulis sp.]MBO6765543.1 DUF2946 family protein [Maricaulis sp.]
MTERPIRTSIILVALVLATLRGLIAPGYMLSASQDGVFEVVLCTEFGSRTIALSAEDFQPVETPQSPAHDTDGEVCPFATVSQAQLPAAAIAYFAQAPPPAPARFAIRSERARPASAFLWPFANAPPVTTV